MLFSCLTSACIIFITLILVRILIVGFMVISLLVQCLKTLKAMSDIFEESHCLMERPRLLRGLGPCQSYLLIECTNYLVLSYFLAVSGMPPDIRQAIKEVIN